jgi:thiol-disulfide isomerase/thioredoxin
MLWQFVFLFLVGHPASQSAALNPGDVAPSFALPKLSGRYFYMGELCGENPRRTSATPKVVVLDFWATWCQPCHKTLPAVRRVVNESDVSRVGLVIICEDAMSAKAQIERRLEPFASHEICVMDPYHFVMKERYGLEEIPATFVISADRRVVAKLGPEIDEDGLVKLLRVAIEKAYR